MGVDRRKLQAIHRACWQRAASRGILARSWLLTCNGDFVAEADLRGAGDQVVPLARQIAGHFDTGPQRPVTPVTWWTLAHHGVTIRGTPVQDLELQADAERLRAWTARNLLTYWQPWAEVLTRGGPSSWPVRATQLHHRRLAAWGVLGTARMHAALATGRVITKEQAGDYALATFPPRWHPVIRDALGYWRGEPRPPGRRAADVRADTAAFVRHIIANT